MDRYVAEAEAVIKQEIELHGEQYAAMSPAAPTPLGFEIKGFRDYLGGLDSLPGSAKLMAATEEAFQYLLKINSSALAVAENRDKLYELANANAAQIHALESSLSWRLTRPLRGIADKIRKF